jgi:hypothetical protein
VRPAFLFLMDGPLSTKQLNSPTRRANFPLKVQIHLTSRLMPLRASLSSQEIDAAGAFLA